MIKFCFPVWKKAVSAKKKIDPCETIHGFVSQGFYSEPPYVSILPIKYLCNFIHVIRRIITLIEYSSIIEYSTNQAVRLNISISILRPIFPSHYGKLLIRSLPANNLYIRNRPIQHTYVYIYISTPVTVVVINSDGQASNVAYFRIYTEGKKKSDNTNKNRSTRDATSWPSYTRETDSQNFSLLIETRTGRVGGRSGKRRAQLTLPAVVSFFFFFFRFNYDPGVYMQQRVAGGSLAQRNTPCNHFAPSCSHLRTIPDQWPVFLFADFKVTCCLFSYVGVHTFSQHSPAHRPNSSVRAVARQCGCARSYVSRHTWAKHRAEQCGRRSTCVKRVLYTCHRTDRWTPCRFHFHSSRVEPPAEPGSGNAVGQGSLFFSRFFTPFLQTVRVLR